MQKKITKLQAFNAMNKLFQVYYDIDSSGDIGGILGSMAFLKNKKPIDRAMLKDWTESLDIFLKYRNLRNYNHLTIYYSFLAMGEFLEGFFGVNDISWEIKLIEDNVRLARQKKRVDPVLWQNWLKCVDAVLAVKDSRAYFYLLPKNRI